MKFIIIIYMTNKLTIVEMENIRGARLRKFKLRKIILGVRMHFRHTYRGVAHTQTSCTISYNNNKKHHVVDIGRSLVTPTYRGETVRAIEFYYTTVRRRIGLLATSGLRGELEVTLSTLSIQ